MACKLSQLQLSICLILLFFELLQVSLVGEGTKKLLRTKSVLSQKALIRYALGKNC